MSRLVKNPVGKVRKVSVAVAVDGIYKEGTETKGDKGGKHYTSRSPEEMKNIENIVKRAIGYDEERGDRVEVINMAFYWSVQEEEARPVKTNRWEEYLKMAYKPAISIILALLCIFFVIRPMLKRRPLAQEGELPLLQPVQNSMIPSEVRAEAKPSHVSSRDQTLQMIQTDPSKAIGVVKSWLHERE
jgi:flagellar M-ring protein FliF